MNKFAVALLVLLACVAVFAIEKPLKNEEADLSDSSLSFEDLESQYEAQVKLGQPPVKPKPQPKGKPAKSKGVPVKPTGKVAPVTKSTKSTKTVGPVKPIKPTKTVPAVPTTKATKTKVAPVTKTSKTAPVTKTVTKSTKTAPVTKSTKTAPVTKSTKSTKTAVTKPTKPAPVTKSTKTAPVTKSTKTAPVTKSKKTAPAKKAPPKKKKKGPPKKKTKTTTDPCTTTATGKGKGKGKGKGMSTGTTNTTATNTKVTKFTKGKGKGKSTGTTTDPCAPAPPACNNTVCGSTCCEFSDQVCCNDQCVTNGTFCCPSGQIASNYPPDATLTTCTNQTMCCPIGQVNCAGTCTLESQCCGYNIVCNPQPISGNTQCCRTGPNSVSTGDYCCPDPNPANSPYNLTCSAPCCGASRTCCPLSNNQQCTNTAVGICCPNAGDFYNATAGTCCSSPFCATNAGQLCCQSQAVTGTSCVAPTNSPVGTWSRCCAPSYTTCGNTCCPSSGTCNNGVCCTSDVSDNFVPIAVYNGTTTGSPSLPAAANSEVIISGFVPATRDPFNYACVSLNDYQAASCAGPNPSGPSALGTVPNCARNIDPPTTNPGFTQANHLNNPTSSRASLNPGATINCAFPDFLDTPSPAQPYTIWQSDITRPTPVNRLTVTTRIPVPQVFNFAVSMVYSRAANGINTCLSGAETSSAVPGSDCGHWPFNTGGVTAGCNVGSLVDNNYAHPVARFYLHFEDINGVRQNDLVYDIIPGQDATETTQASSPSLNSKDMPTTATGPFQIFVWGGNGFNRIPRNIYIQGVQLPTTYRSYVLIGYDLVDTTNGDPMCTVGDAFSMAQCQAMPTIVANQGVACADAATRRPKVQTSLWSTSVKTACVLYGGTAVQPDRGYPA